MLGLYPLVYIARATRYRSPRRLGREDVASRRQLLLGFEGPVRSLPSADECPPRPPRLRALSDALSAQPRPGDLWLGRLNLLPAWASNPPNTDRLPLHRRGALGILCDRLRVLAAKGQRPVIFGHLQTLVDLVDEWPEVGERMFWGGKYGEEVIRRSDENRVKVDLRTESNVVVEESSLKKKMIAHAGTAARALECQVDEIYIYQRETHQRIELIGRQQHISPSMITFHSRFRSILSWPSLGTQ